MFFSITYARIQLPAAVTQEFVQSYKYIGDPLFDILRVELEVDGDVDID